MVGIPDEKAGEEPRVVKPHREDLAFLMYTDQDIVAVIEAPQYS